MGKTANNERIKLEATFFNNCSVALYVAGGFLPLIAIYPRFNEIMQMPPVMPWGLNLISSYGTASVVAVIAGVLFRRKADQIIQQIED